MYGFFSGNFGIAESARAYAKALLEVDYPVSLVDLAELNVPHDMNDKSLADYYGREASYPTNIIFVNPDWWSDAIDFIGTEKLQGRHTIACWFWETERLPPRWMDRAELVDSFLVASSFIASSLLDVVDEQRIVRMPVPIYSPAQLTITRKQFGLHPSARIYLLIFDFQSHIARKNPWAAIDSFRSAFGQREDVQLLIKTSNGTLHRDKLVALQDYVAYDSNIVVRDGVLTGGQVSALQEVCDVLISLHRSEGFGLNLAEFMRKGKPVIATGWSGNTEFMSHENSILVDYELVPILDGEYPLVAGQRWANVNVDSAVKALKRVDSDTMFRRKIGARAGLDVSEHLDPARIGMKLAHYLEMIQQQHIVEDETNE